MTHHLDHNARLCAAHCDQPDPIGNEDGETCNRVDPPYEGPRRNWRAKPCKGVMKKWHRNAPEIVECNTCGEIGE